MCYDSKPHQYDWVGSIVWLQVIRFRFFRKQSITVFEIGQIYRKRVRLRLFVDGNTGIYSAVNPKSGRTVCGSHLSAREPITNLADRVECDRPLCIHALSLPEVRHAPFHWLPPWTKDGITGECAGDGPRRRVSFQYCISGAAVYLFLRGVGYGCCVGSLTILMAGASSPKILFSAEEFLIESVLPLENGNGVQFVGKSSLSEARATKNAESYDPYQVFHIDGAANATYDLQLSKAYSTDHYCEWAGSKYNENLVAVVKPVSSSTCHVMTEERFTDYLHRHPGEFK